MIHHLSISAYDPKRVAGVLAELMGERYIRFRLQKAGSWLFAMTIMRHWLCLDYPLKMKGYYSLDKQEEFLTRKRYREMVLKRRVSVIGLIPLKEFG